MDTQAQQLVLHFSSRMHATFSAAWSHPGLGQDSLVPPVYSISQVWPSSQGLSLTPTQGRVARSTAGGGKQISDLHHVIICLLDQPLLAGFSASQQGL